MKSIILKSKQSKTYCQSLIEESPEDGSITVEIKKTKKDSTSAQRRLQWLWATEVSQSGLGADDNKMDVHIRAKYMFGMPILMRDHDIFPIIFVKFQESVKFATNRSELYKIFCSEYISTEKMTKEQRAEYLTNFQKYWIGKGVNLTDPSLQGLDHNKLF
jgi:hypothetical protein